MTHLESMIELDLRALWNFNKIKYQSIQNDFNMPMKTTCAKSNLPPTYDPIHFNDLCVTCHSVNGIYDTDANALEITQVGPACYSATTQGSNPFTDVDSLAHDPHALISMTTTKAAVIFDTGASLGITHDIQDFDKPLTIPKCDLHLGGMANGMKIEGVGPVTRTFSNKDGTEVQICSQCYFVPQSKRRLISPQHLFNKDKGVNGWYKGDEETFKLQFEGCPCLTVEYDSSNHLPIGNAKIGAGIAPQVNFALKNEGNQNISAGQKLLLHWHSRFGHLNLPAVQQILRAFPFTANQFASASKCDTLNLKFKICHYAKGHRSPTHSSMVTADSDRTGALKAEHLGPGVRVSVDHFESRLLGRTFESYGKPSADTYKGGCIFVDHGTGYIQVEHQLGFSAVENIRAKQNYEQQAMDNGVIVQSYLTGSGAFKANTFIQHI